LTTLNLKPGFLLRRGWNSQFAVLGLIYINCVVANALHFNLGEVDRPSLEANAAQVPKSLTPELLLFAACPLGPGWHPLNVVEAGTAANPNRDEYKRAPSSQSTV